MSVPRDFTRLSVAEHGHVEATSRPRLSLFRTASDHIEPRHHRVVLVFEVVTMQDVPATV